MSKQKELVMVTSDSLYIACECGCKIFRLYDLEEDGYYLEIYNDYGHKPISKKDRKLISNIRLHKEDLKNLLDSINNKDNLGIVIYEYVFGNEKIKLTKDELPGGYLYFLDILSKKGKKEINLSGIIIIEEQLKDLKESLTEFIN